MKYLCNRATSLRKPLLILAAAIALLCAVGCDEHEVCGKVGEQISSVYDVYPAACCEGLTEWPSGMDTRISIGGSCYETGLVAGAPVGTCIDCGDGSCSELEDPCNCAQDCPDGQNADYGSLEEFCAIFEGSNIEAACTPSGDIHALLHPGYLAPVTDHDLAVPGAGGERRQALSVVKIDCMHDRYGAQSGGGQAAAGQQPGRRRPALGGQ